MSKAVVLACLSFALLPLGSAGAQEEPFVGSLPLRDYTAELTIDFHDDKATMVPCTLEQVSMIGARGMERLEELLPAIGARLVGRKAAAGESVQVLLDAACYQDGIMGLGGYGRGEEEVTLAYEESTDGETWGPARRGVQTEQNNQTTDQLPEGETEPVPQGPTEGSPQGETPAQ